MGVVIPANYGVAAFEFSYLTGTPPFVTTLGVNLAGYDGTFEDAANKLMASWGGDLSPGQHVNFNLDRVLLTVNDGTSTGTVSSSLAPFVGDRGGAIAPVAMAAVVYKNTATLGRAGKGRAYLPGFLLNDDVQSSGYLATGVAAGAADAYQTFLTSVATDNGDGGGMPSVVLHSAESGLAPGAITSVSGRPLVGWIRGRIF